MFRLADMKCVVAGGTGTVGEAIVEVFLAEGANVVVPSRSQAAIDRLRGYLGNVSTEGLATLVGDLGEIDDAARLRDEIVARVGPIDAVVASLGGTWEEKLKLIDVPLETWRAFNESNLTPHFVAARTFLPLLARARQGMSHRVLIF